MRRDGVEELLDRLRLPEPVLVTRPTPPPLDRYCELLEKVWASRRFTNQGPFHEAFEAELSRRFDGRQVLLFANGTLALMAALHALGITEGEVVTTPFTFPATVHAVTLAGLTPVFADVDPGTGNLDPETAAKQITPNTRALLPVHVYGTPCDIEGFASLERKHAIPVVYDGAHAFGVRVAGRALEAVGTTMLSFHATKPFSTVEGGALVIEGEAALRAARWRNFGIVNEEVLDGVGLNAKMNELQSVYGLLALESVADEIEARGALEERYRQGLANVAGIRFVARPADVRSNHAYMPIFIEEEAYGMDRDRVYALLSRAGVGTRKYFHPLMSRVAPYRDLPSAAPDVLPAAERLARECLCLPLYGTLESPVVDAIVELLVALPRTVSEGRTCA